MFIWAGCNFLPWRWNICKESLPEKQIESLAEIFTSGAMECVATGYMGIARETIDELKSKTRLVRFVYCRNGKFRGTLLSHHRTLDRIRVSNFLKQHLTKWSIPFNSELYGYHLTERQAAAARSIDFYLLLGLLLGMGLGPFPKQQPKRQKLQRCRCR